MCEVMAYNRVRINPTRVSLLFVVLGLRCLLDCHVLKGFGIYMIGILDRLYRSGEELSSGFARMFYSLMIKELSQPSTRRHGQVLAC